MPMQITPELREWMKLYEAPFRFNAPDLEDVNSDTVLNLGRSIQAQGFGTWLTQQLNELYEQNKEKEG